MKLLFKILISIVIAASPLVSFADKANADEVKKMCLDGFMKDADKTSDPDTYKSYVNKLCDCTAIKLGGKEVDQSGVW